MFIDKDLSSNFSFPSEQTAQSFSQSSWLRTMANFFANISRFFLYQGMEKLLLNQASIPEKLKSVLNIVDDAIIIIDRDQNFLFSNPAVERILGKRLNTSFLKDLTRPIDSQHSINVAPFRANHLPLIRSLQGEKVNDVEMFVRHTNAPNGSWVSVTGRPIRDQNGMLTGSVIVCRDISKHKQIEQARLYDAFHDKLTGLPNRNHLLERLEKIIEFSKQIEDYQFAVLFLDLDRFKVINDSLGHSIGDQLLIAVSQRLKTCLRSEDTIIRLGGDEFAILLESIQDVDCAVQIAERINQGFIQPFDLDGHEVFADVSIGIAMGATEYNRPEEILRDADTAMYHAKGLGKSCYQLFDQTMHVRAVRLLQLENDLRRAIERQEFQLHYQPIVALQTQRIIGFEALVRWRHPERGLVSPVEFIPIAEETGLIIPLGSWVLRDACRQMQKWRLQFPAAAAWTISVNISEKQLSKANFVDQIKQTLLETHLDACSLKLEITESLLLENSQSVTSKLAELQALGIQLSMDDFGTGYSSLSYLLNFPFNTLKIDCSFIKNMDVSSEKLGIIRAIVTLAGNLGMEVVAEGVETANHLAQLKVLKCDYGQGHFFSKPLNNKAAETLIATECREVEGVKLQNPRAVLEEQISREKLLFHIENLHYELEELKQEKKDLEILLETTTEHAEIIESELHKEICDYKQAEKMLQQASQELESPTIVDN